MRRSPSAACLFVTAAACLLALAPLGAAEGLDLEPIVVRQGVEETGSGLVAAVITREDIERRAFSSVEDVLSALGADLQARGRFGIKSDLALNASTFQQVLILVNGVRIKDSQTAHHDLDLFFNVEDIERVELIPAAASVKYGPDGIGGAVNFVLRAPVVRAAGQPVAPVVGQPAAPAAGQPAAPAAGQPAAVPPSANQPPSAKNSFSLAGGNDETFEARGRLNFAGLAGHHTFSAAHAQSGGSRYDTDLRTETFFYSAGWGDEDAHLILDAGYNEKEFGAYDFYTPHCGYPSKEWTNTRFVSLRARTGGTGIGGDTWTVEPRVSFRQHDDTFALSVENLALYLNHHRTDTYGIGATVTRHFDAWTLPLGFDYGEERIASSNLGDHNRGHWDVILDPRFELSDQTALNVTLRLDDYTTSGSDLTGGISLIHATADRADVYVTLGRTMRVPTFTELYYSDPTTTGHPDLEPEHAINIEAGWHKKVTPDTEVSLSVFGRREEDTIDFTKLTAADALFVARNISRAHTWGLNGFGRWQAGDTTAFDLRYVYSDKNLDDDGKLYKYGPSYLKHMVRLGFDWILSFGHNRCDVVMKKKPTRRAWVVVNDRLTLPISDGWRIFFEVYNLFNQEYQEIDGIPEQGRLFKLGLDLRW